jgi:long-chain acyl-CoA synthetase
MDAHDTILGLFAARVATSGNQPAIHVRRGEAFVARNWNEVAEDVRRSAAALVGLGVQRGDRVLLVSPNRYEWIVCDLAIQMAQAVHVPVHASLAGPQIAYQVADSGARVMILAGPEQVEKLRPHATEFPPDLQVVTFDSVGEPWTGRQFHRFADLLSSVDGDVALRLQKQGIESVAPDDLATMIYTSGTTGEPKGVMLTQRNLASNACASVAAFGQRPGDVRLTWLPLSHIFARTCDYYTWLACGSELALADSPESVIANCGLIRPTLLNGVPYFFEKVQRALIEKGLDQQPGSLAKWFGGRLRAGVSGGAPLPDHVAVFYQQHGVRLYQGYGLTETSPVISTGTEAYSKLGTVGRAIPGVEVKIADDGEILTRGPHVMRGYWNKPDATAEVLRDGWFHTGDLGELDAEGYLKITGRKKELIVTAGGKNIAPAYLEALLTADPLIQQAIVIGDRRNYLTALIVPNREPLRAAIIKNRIPVTSAEEALRDTRVRQLYADRIRERLAGVSRYEQVCNFTLLGQGFTLEGGELTPTLKLRRGVILAKYAALIDAMYAVTPPGATCEEQR